MFCPKCEAEYRSGFNRCKSCDVDLVEQLPEMSKQQNEIEKRSESVPGGFEQVCRIENEAELVVIYSFLQGTDIPFYLQSSSRHRFGQPTAPANLMVEKSRVEEVLTLLKNFGFSFPRP